MRKHVLPISFLLLALGSLSVNAESVTRQQLPEKMSRYLAKKYPEATNINLEKKTHFGLDLYQLKFTVTQYDLNNQPYKEELSKFFRLNGYFFGNGIIVENNAFNIIPTEAVNSLKSHYPDYEIQAMQTVVNPNSIGEEYEIELISAGKKWNVSLDNQGNVISEKTLED